MRFDNLYKNNIFFDDSYYGNTATKQQCLLGNIGIVLR